MLRSSKVTKNDFANRVRALRAKNELTSSALAKSAGVSPAAIWQWENSGAIPRRPTLARLAAKLGVSESFLLTGIPGGSPPPDTFTAPSIAPPSQLEDILLEDLIRAIEHKGFVVTLRSRDV
jgi:transcriptional regulator with XRE-family HTH domain